MFLEMPVWGTRSSIYFKIYPTGRDSERGKHFFLMGAGFFDNFFLSHYRVQWFNFAVILKWTKWQHLALEKNLKKKIPSQNPELLWQFIAV